MIRQAYACALDWRGTASRADLGWFTLFSLTAAPMLAGVTGWLLSFASLPCAWSVGLVLIWTSLAWTGLAVRRIRDSGNSPWLLALLAAIGMMTLPIWIHDLGEADRALAGAFNPTGAGQAPDDLTFFLPVALVIHLVQIACAWGLLMQAPAGRADLPPLEKTDCQSTDH